MPDSIGRAAMIAVVAGLLFAGFLAMTPRLTASSQTVEAVGPATVESTVPVVEQAVIAEPVVAVAPSQAYDGYDPDTPPVVETSDEVWPADEVGEDLGLIDGTLELTVELLGPRDGKEVATLMDEDTVDWHFRATNASDGDLWGVYVYLEGFGHVSCDVRHIEAGVTTDCWASKMVWSGDQIADAWATAWTTKHEVAAEISYSYFVGD